MIEVPIKTERLTIRRFEPRDLDAYLRFMLDKESTRFLAFVPEQKTENGAKALFDYVVKSYNTNEPVHAYAIVASVTGDYLGSCGFAPYEAGSVECYYCVNSEHRGKGIAVEATKAMILALSSTSDVRAYCHPENTAAHAVAKKCGMKHAGFARNKNTGLEGDVFVYATGLRKK